MADSLHQTVQFNLTLKVVGNKQKIEAASLRYLQDEFVALARSVKYN